MTIKKNHVFNFARWTKPLSYLVGIYLSDGCVHLPTGRRMKIFSHSSIDEEFVRKTMSALRVVLGPLHTVRYRAYERQYKKGGLIRKNYSRVVYETSVSNDDFCHWLQDVTRDKTIVPMMGRQYLQELLSGFLDGDGYINIFRDAHVTKRGERGLCYQAGICGVGPKMLSVVKAFNKLGVWTGKKTLGKRDVETYKLRLSDLAKSGICFAIHRKFFKFCEYVNQVIKTSPQRLIRRTLLY